MSDKDGSSEYPQLKGDKTKSQATLEFHDFMLREMRTSFKDLRGDVKELRTDSTTVLERLDNHIRECEERRRSKPATVAQSPALEKKSEAFTKPWFWKKTAERAIDYGVFAAIIVVIKYAGHLPMPTP